MNKTKMMRGGGELGLNLRAFIANSEELATSFEIVPELTVYRTGNHRIQKPSLRVILYADDGEEINNTIINYSDGEKVKKGLERLNLQDKSERNKIPVVIIQEEKENLVPGVHITNPLLISLIYELSARPGFEEFADNHPLHIDLIKLYGRDEQAER